MGWFNHQARIALIFVGKYTDVISWVDVYLWQDKTYRQNVRQIIATKEQDSSLERRTDDALYATRGLLINPDAGSRYGDPAISRTVVLILSGKPPNAVLNSTVDQRVKLMEEFPDLKFIAIGTSRNITEDQLATISGDLKYVRSYPSMDAFRSQRADIYFLVCQSYQHLFPIVCLSFSYM